MSLTTKGFSSDQHAAPNSLALHVDSSWPEAIAPGTVIEVGLSGGVDSVVLLHVLAALREKRGIVLKAVHVHHGLNSRADEWADFCRKYCMALNVPLRVEHVDVKHNSRLGIEAEARKERYRVFSDGLSQVVALAHHQNDQVETFMLAALRGGGLRALSAMPRMRMLNAATQIWRPLLDIPRIELEKYTAENGLEYIEDDSNQNPAFLRNWLRNEALPLWRERVPHLDSHVISSIKSLQGELALLNEVIAEDYADICRSGWFDIERWKSLSRLRRHQQLLHHAKTNGLGIPRAESVEDFARTLAQAATAEWSLPQGKMYAYRGRLFAQKNGWENACPWVKNGGIQQGRLKDIIQKNSFTLDRHSFGLCEEVLDSLCIIRSANADDAIELAVGRKNVWKILQERKIPPFARRYWPVVIDSQNRCVAIANILVNVHYGCRNGSMVVFSKFNQFILEPK